MKHLGFHSRFTDVSEKLAASFFRITSTVILEAASFYEISVAFYQAARRRTPKDLNFICSNLLKFTDKHTGITHYILHTIYYG
jgi:hypothetical protein